ncbi:MAG: DNA-processing protein DprA [Phycisphaerales bacterium]|nr:MAG: DNA-processing protein DprA [Phycisphaerales bacterium]
MAREEPNSVEVDKWLKLIRADGVGPVTFARLLERFGSVDRALGASVSELGKVEGIGFRTAERIAGTREKFDASAEIDLAASLGVYLLSLQDSRYPPMLKRIHDPPPVLYVKGSLTRDDNLAVSIVGSRRCSMYGREQSGRLAHMLASAGFTICSGMARGIDTEAHNGALAARGRTIAVQGCGLANVFPPENKRLFGLVCESGACISELPLGYEPLAENFPPRNRIIAGLSLGTIVIEAGLRSGALITAAAALDYNREVMAVPGKIDSPLARGSNRLIKQGAKLVESVEDVIEALGYFGEQLQDHVAAAAENAARAAQTPLFDVGQLKLAPDEKRIHGLLTKEPTHIEQIIADTGLSPGAVNAALVSLRLKALIKQLPGSFFVSS